MTLWLVEPRDPLIVREGRPFGPDAGASATTLPFPFPSTIAGGIRSRFAIDEHGIFKYERTQNMSQEELQAREQQLEQLKMIGIRGPLLVELADEGNDLATIQDKDQDSTINTEAWLVPFPNDALLLKDTSQDHAPANTQSTDAQEGILLRRLVPTTLPSSARTDFDQEATDRQLLLIGQETSSDQQSRKPLAHKLRYWHWKHFHIWLTHPEQLTQRQDLSLSSLGYEDLVRDYRQHVSMDSEKEMGKEGLLFGTSGLEFTVALR